MAPTIADKKDARRALRVLAKALDLQGGPTDGLKGTSDDGGALKGINQTMITIEVVETRSSGYKVSVQLGGFLGDPYESRFDPNSKNLVADVKKFLADYNAVRVVVEE